MGDASESIGEDLIEDAEKDYEAIDVWIFSDRNLIVIKASMLTTKALIWILRHVVKHRRSWTDGINFIERWMRKLETLWMMMKIWRDSCFNVEIFTIKINQMMRRTMIVLLTLKKLKESFICGLRKNKQKDT